MTGDELERLKAARTLLNHAIAGRVPIQDVAEAIVSHIAKATDGQVPVA